jgi:hypothetical protein
MALDAAKTADDGPLIARCWVEQATTLGQDTLNRAVGAGPVVRGYLTAAAVKAGSDNDIRAGAQYRLAYEHAAIGEWKEARVALSHAETAASHAGWSHSRRGAMAGSSLWVMDELSDAEFALSDGMGCEGSCRLGSLAWLARVHVDSGDADAALEDILQADRETREIHRGDLAPQLRAVAGTLPANLRTIAFDHLNFTAAPPRDPTRGVEVDAHAGAGDVHALGALGPQVHLDAVEAGVEGDVGERSGNRSRSRAASPATDVLST